MDFRRGARCRTELLLPQSRRGTFRGRDAPATSLAGALPKFQQDPKPRAPCWHLRDGTDLGGCRTECLTCDDQWLASLLAPHRLPRWSVVFCRKPARQPQLWGSEFVTMPTLENN